MKRMAIFAVFALLLMLSSLTSPLPKASANSISDNSVITLSGQTEGNRVIIKANLVENPGISAMTLDLSYDKSAMTLSNVVFGTALSSLNPMTTNTDTPDGYAITPFVFNYSGKANDFSTGLMFTMTFNLSASVVDGNYLVSLKYTKNQDVNYIDASGTIRTKNLYIDNAQVQILDNSVVQISPVREKDAPSTILIIVLGLLLGGVVTCAVLFATKFFRKQRNWKRI